MGRCIPQIPSCLANFHPHRTEAAIALRQRLNETVEQLETLRKEHAELEVKFDTLNRELIVAKSDCKFNCIFSLLSEY
jgi:hypothetical protein